MSSTAVNFPRDFSRPLPDGRFSALNPQICLELLFVSKEEYGPDWRSHPHSHHNTELIYVFSGKGFFSTQKHRIPISKGQLIVINPHLLHTELSDKNNPLRYYAIAFTGLHFDNIREDNCILDLSESNPEFGIYFRKMFEYIQKDSPFGLDFVYNTFLNLIIQLLEITNSSIHPHIEITVSNELEEVKKYIDLNYYQPISLDELADIAFVSKTQLIRLFKKIYHTTPLNYIIEKRVNIAKFLFEHTDNSITAVAEIVGFNSVSNFIKKFRESTGCTPKEYRNSLK